MLRVVRVLLRHRRRAARAVPADGVPVLVVGGAVEPVVARLGAAEGAARLLELAEGHGGQGGGVVVLGLVVVDLVDGLGGVHDVALHRLLLDDGLDLLVHVVVDVLAAERGRLGVGVPGA